MVVVNENKPDDIREIMQRDGFESSVSIPSINPNCRRQLAMDDPIADLFSLFGLFQHHTDCQDSPCRKRKAIYSQVCADGIRK